MKTISVSEFCESQSISRNTFYHHRRRGVFADCYTVDGRLIEPLAAAAYREKVRVNPGGQALRRKCRGLESGPDTFEPAVDVKEFLSESLGDISGLPLPELQRRHEIEKLLLIQLKRRRVEGELIETDEVKADAENVAALLNALLAAMPSRIAPKLMQRDSLAEIQAIIEAEITEVKKAIYESQFINEKKLEDSKNEK